MVHCGVQFDMGVVAWLRCLARCVIGGVAVSWAVEVGVGIEGWVFRMKEKGRNLEH
jgi:hypothetical protein